MKAKAPYADQFVTATKVKVVRLITKIYFLAALAGSFIHIVTAADKTGLHGWEMWATPFLIDGVAVTGLVMRGEEFSQRTRKIGLRVQAGAGLVSLVANVYAANTVGGVMLGVALVGLFLLMEWLGDNIESADVDLARAEAAKREAANAKARARRAAAKKTTAAPAKHARTARRGSLKAV